MRRKTDHAAQAIFWFRVEQVVMIVRVRGRAIPRPGGEQSFQGVVRRRHDSHKVVVKDKSAAVGRVEEARLALVPRAQGARGIIPGELFFGDLFHLSQPGAPGAMRRDQNPFPDEGIKTAVGLVKVHINILTEIRLIGTSRNKHNYSSCLRYCSIFSSGAG
jgi:hypothetical protein